MEIFDFEAFFKRVYSTTPKIPIPFERRVYLSSLTDKQIEEFKRRGAKIYQGEKGAFFFDRDELKRLGIDVSKLKTGKEGCVLCEISDMIDEGRIDEVKEMLINGIGTEFGIKSSMLILKKISNVGYDVDLKDVSDIFIEMFREDKDELKKFGFLYKTVTNLVEKENLRLFGFLYDIDFNDFDEIELRRAIWNFLMLSLSLSDFGKSDRTKKFLSVVKELYGIDFSDKDFRKMIVDENGLKFLEGIDDEDGVLSILDDLMLIVNGKKYKPTHYFGLPEDLFEKVRDHAITIIYDDDLRRDVCNLFKGCEFDELNERYEKLIDEIIHTEKLDKDDVEKIEFNSKFRRWIKRKKNLFDGLEEINGIYGFVDGIVMLYKRFKKFGYDDKEAIGLAKGFMILHMWCNPDFSKFCGKIEKYVHELEGNHRPIRAIVELNSKLCNHLLDDCLYEFASAVKLSKEIFSELVGMSAKVYRGINNFEMLQVIESIVNGKDLKIKGTLLSTTLDYDIAEKFAVSTGVISFPVDKDLVIGGFWNSSPGLIESEKEIIADIPRDGMDIEFIPNPLAEKYIKYFEDKKYKRIDSESKLAEFIDVLNILIDDVAFCYDYEMKYYPKKNVTEVVKNILNGLNKIIDDIDVSVSDAGKLNELLANIERFEIIADDDLRKDIKKFKRKLMKKFGGD